MKNLILIKNSPLWLIYVCISLLGMSQAAYAQIVVNSSTRWIDTHINVERGSLIQLSATGVINVGGGLGSYSPAGILGPHSLSFPTDEPYIYGLVARLTNSTTSPYDEIREDWSYGNWTSYCARSAGHLWLAVNDDNLTDNSGEFTVTITLTTCTATDDTYRSTVVHVVDGAGSDVVGADVYIDGVFRGRSDRWGLVRLPAQNPGAQIIARKLVLENPTYRRHHSLGSTRDWNYRVYNTSMTVNNDGTFSNTTVTEPNATYTVTILSTNTLIGLNWLASFEWDASEREFRELYENNIIPASQRLFNATDGQFFVEQISIVDNATFWEDTDFRIFANWSLRANVNRRRGGFLYDNILFGGTWMNMNRLNDNYVYAHEFGHYGFDLGDEYADDSPISCTRNIGSATSPFGWMGANRQPAASCIMWNSAPKLCSDHFLNPHVGSTNQGEQSCWEHLVEAFDDNQIFPRYFFKTPTTRGQIMGTVGTIPVRDWRPRLHTNNSSRGSLCAPLQVIVTRLDNGAPMADVEVFNQTHYGQLILAGKTQRENPDTPELEEGTIMITGVHIGDRIMASGGSFVVSSCGAAMRIAASSYDASTSGDVAGNAGSSFRINSKDKQPGKDSVKTQSPVHVLPVAKSSSLTITSVQTHADSTITFYVSSAVKLQEPPQVQLILSGEAKAKDITLHWEEATKMYAGTSDKLPGSLQGTLVIRAKDKKGRELSTIQQILISPVNPKEENEIFSHDGQFAVKIPAATFSQAQVISIINKDISLPNQHIGKQVISGPYKVSLNTNETLYKAAVLRFQLPDLMTDKEHHSANYNDGILPYDPASLYALYYNESAETWKEVPVQVIKEIAVVTFPSQGEGTYLLIGKESEHSNKRLESEQGATEVLLSQMPRLAPNPASQSTSLSFNLTKEARVQVAVLDISGRQVMRIADTIFNSGQQKLNINTSGLPKGLYFVKILVNNKGTTLKLSVN